MSANESKTVQNIANAKAIEAEVRADGLKFIYESQQKWFWQMLDALIKGSAFYLTITAAIIGYVLSKDLPPSLQRSILILGIITSVLFIIGATACARGLHACLTPLENSLKDVNLELAVSMNLSHVFSVMRRVMWIVVICSGIVFSMFIVAMFFLLRQIGG
ncbi:MAG TPA: hypothetical protein VF666_03125 [Pyrinomonadaceae bacterium]|jgi:tetrahydromethanopterin S-methyltransferase subunit C